MGPELCDGRTGPNSRPRSRPPNNWLERSGNQSVRREGRRRPIGINGDHKRPQMLCMRLGSRNDESVQIES